MKIILNTLVLVFLIAAIISLFIIGDPTFSLACCSMSGVLQIEKELSNDK